MLKVFAKTLIMLGLCGSLIACSSLPEQKSNGTQPLSLNDPFEGFNRGVYKFNKGADKLILRPVAKSYDYVVPKPAKTGVSNFFSNLGEPLNALNSLLQGKWEDGLKSTYRFMVNSTIGLFGLFDVATHYDVEEVDEDFGQTLAAWGVKPGPYVMLPFLGPTNFRDGISNLGEGSVANKYALVSSDSSDQLDLRLLNIVDRRRAFLATDKLLDSQLDEYSFVRRAYYANRLNKVFDGDPPKEKLDDVNDF
jgi:phospholipid-binding lipoprotein MlaA